SIIALDAFDVALTQQNILIIIAIITLQFLVFAIFIKHKKPTLNNNDIFTFSKKQTILIVILIIFTIAVKGIFLINTIFPTATDLGHHMFWVEKITVDQSLPSYEKIEIEMNDNTPSFTQPQPIADFIVGEHIIFAVIKTFTGQSVVSTFPSLVLFIINIFSILMLFILSRRLFERYRHGAQIAILTLLFVGPLWAISGASAKFISGGVIGNLLGNLLIPAIIYFLYRAFYEKKATLLIGAIILITGLTYTHHLSTFIFGYIFIFSIISFVLLQKDGWDGYKKLFLLLKNPYIIPLLLFVISAILFLVPPSYLDREAISSSVGAPSKSTRTGVPFEQLMYMLGSARFVFGMIGLLMLSLFALLRRFGKLSHMSKKSVPANIYGTVFLLGWGWALILMSLVPHFLKVNIISTRIATYGAFPLAIFAGLSFVWIISILFYRKKNSLIMPQFLISLFLFVIITFTFVSGIRDNATSMNDAPKTNKALQTFHVGDYASKVFKSEISQNNFWLVKDHNYITSDTWLKVFFAHDYSFPLSRSYFKRYETHPNRETCTREMIS
ncbi:MAG: hypothetical protein U9Q12_04280, partial [Patescibacteria group bacterium]|nr:hypothetical protein [Patescibacteria group bacterium]